MKTLSLSLSFILGLILLFGFKTSIINMFLENPRSLGLGGILIFNYLIPSIIFYIILTYSKISKYLILSKESLKFLRIGLIIYICYFLLLIIGYIIFGNVFIYIKVYIMIMPLISILLLILGIIIMIKDSFKDRKK